jgi:D-inositol-3-phosphate glycosyltransferase
MSHRPLRVAVLSVHTCPFAALGGKKTGGMNVYIRELSRELVKSDIHVDIFTREQDSCQYHVDDFAVPGMRVIHIAAGSPAAMPAVAIYDHLPQFTQGVLDFAAKQPAPYDLVHSHYWLSGWVGQRLKAEWNVPLIQMFHTLGHMKNRVADSPDEMEPPLRMQVEQETMQKADCLIAATPAEKIQLMWLYRADMHKIRIIPPGVDVHTFHPIPRPAARAAVGVEGDCKLLVYVGRLEALKGIDSLMEAIVILREQLPALAAKLCVAIVGGATDPLDPEDVELVRLQELRQRLNLGDLVTFIGGRAQNELPEYYAAAEVVIMPSHYESFGMVALEAMACGTPVVASEVGGLAYLIQDGITGFHVPDRDPVELAGKIRLLLENVELRREMSGAAVTYAQQYAWGRIAQEITAVYDEFAPE